MRKHFWFLASWLLWLTPLAIAAEPGAGLPNAPAPNSPKRATPGIEAAQALSTITGVAISPLLGVSAVGAWKYFKAPPANRAQLPWFARPYFWVPALLLVVAVFVKDVAGTAKPATLKTPFDVLELFD